MKVKIFSTLRDICGGSEVSVQASTVKEIIDKCTEKFGEEFEKELLDEKGSLIPGVIILVNGRNIHFLDGVQTRVSDSDEIAIFPPSGGG